MGQRVRLQWLSEVGGLGVPRRDRKGGSYDAYVPDRLVGRAFAFDGATAADVSDAERALASFDARAVALTSTEALARLLLRAESVASSHIEGLVISPQRLLRVALDRAEGVAVSDDTAIEVLGNVDAMAFAVQSEGDITVERLLEVHRRLLAPTRAAEHAGRIREGQNWIGGSDYNPLSAAFVPPPANEVLPLLEDLCAFCNDDMLPAVAQAAIAHAQFETIHPFVDGNGRTGRALISMVLRRRGLARRAAPPISLVLATRAKGYIAALDATRFVGSPMSRRGGGGAEPLDRILCRRLYARGRRCGVLRAARRGARRGVAHAAWAGARGCLGAGAPGAYSGDADPDRAGRGHRPRSDVRRRQ